MGRPRKSEVEARAVMETVVDSNVPDSEKADVKKLSVARKLTRYEIGARRKQVMRLRLRGFSEDMIAKLLNVSVFTVSRDLQAIQQENAERLTDFQKNEFVSSSLAAFQNVAEHAWSEYMSSQPGTPNRLKALDLVRLLEKDRIDALVDTGVIQRDLIPTGNTTVNNIMNIPADLQEKIVAMMLQAACKTPNIDPTPELTAVCENVESSNPEVVDNTHESDINLESDSEDEPVDEE